MPFKKFTLLSVSFWFEVWKKVWIKKKFFFLFLIDFLFYIELYGYISS
jgi:hypothetical protein